MMKEKVVQKRLTDSLRDHYWKVYIFSMHKTVPKMMKGWPDVVAVRWGFVWFLECKGTTGSVSDDQAIFQNDIKRNSGTHIDHCYVWPDTPLEYILHWGAEFRPHDMEYPPKGRMR